jgi:phosphate transport system substrate-binding protein
MNGDIEPNMKKLPYILICLSLFAFVLIGCSSSESQPVEEAPANESNAKIVLKTSGSGSATAVLGAVEDTFASNVDGYSLEVLSGTGTGGGVEGIVAEVLDVAAMARPPKDEEAAQDVEYFEFGLAGQSVITHPDVEITNLTNEEVAAIFSGEFESWADLGGPDSPIILYVRDEGDSSTKALRAEIMGETPFSEGVAQVLTSQGDMLTAVAGTPDSIGIATWPAAVAEEAEVKAITIEGISPGDSDYPMYSPLGIGYLTSRESDVQPLIDWLSSEEGQAALQELDVIIPQK